MSALGEAVDDVDFRFVAGLIDGVFNAIVTSSIKQMEAFADWSRTSRRVWTPS